MTDLALEGGGFKCEADGECPAGEVCFKGACTAVDEAIETLDGAVLGGECGDSVCAAGEVCGPGGACVSVCRSTRDCPAGQECLQGRCAPGDAFPGEGGESGADGDEGATEGGEGATGEGSEGGEGTTGEGIEGLEGAEGSQEGAEGGDGNEGAEEGAPEGPEGTIEGSEGADGGAAPSDAGGADGSVPDAGALPDAGAGTDAGVVPDGGQGADGGTSCQPVTRPCGVCGSQTAACGADGKLEAFGACVDHVNECSGCATLSVKVGDACGECGKWACNGKEDVKCNDPGKHSCMNFQTCTLYATCSSCPPAPPEKCNGIDDDCNGATPENGQATDCPPGQTCHLGQCCRDECPQEGAKECVTPGSFRVCGQHDTDTCLEWSEVTACGPASACDKGLCECAPDCTGKECGSDGCGGTCGSCDGNEVCGGVAPFKCACVPDCSSKQCGDDGCGGSCGTCANGEPCAAGKCQCTPNCTGKECGDDGCGGTCGFCPTQTQCVSGQCECPTCGAGTPCISNAGCNQAYLECKAGICDCKGGFVRNPANNHCYKVFTNGVNWDNANGHCAGGNSGIAAGSGHLVSILDAAENDHVKSITQGDMWTGFNDKATEKTWVWSSGESSPFRAWANGEPNDWFGEDCMLIRPDAKWNDADCADNHGFICEAP